MREILFRGKRIDNGEWVEGSLITDVFYRVGEGNKNSIPYILSVSGIDYNSWEDLDDDYGLYEVDPDTVGQYTGLTDKNGKKIFEGDVLESPLKNILSVGFKKGSFSIKEVDGAEFSIQIKIANDNKCYCSVIGNIHDNPELLKGENND